MLGIWFVIGALGLLLIFAGFLYIIQSRYVYYPERAILDDPGSIGLFFENVSFSTSDGVKLWGWFVPGEIGHGTILFCHGNGGNISSNLDLIQLFYGLGLNVFIFDYRGYGHSEGKPSEKGTYNDVEAAWRYLIEERKIKPNAIIPFGWSLGGAIVSWLAQKHVPGALILQSAFTSIPDIATEKHPFIPVKSFLRFKYNTADFLSRVNCPVLIAHSRDDDIIPFRHGLRLYEQAKEPKAFLEITGTHNEGFITKHYEEELSTFIAKWLNQEV